MSKRLIPVCKVEGRKSTKRWFPGYVVRGCIECHHSREIFDWPYPRRWRCIELNKALDPRFIRCIDKDCPLELAREEE